MAIKQVNAPSLLKNAEGQLHNASRQFNQAFNRMLGDSKESSLDDSKELATESIYQARKNITAAQENIHTAMSKTTNAEGQLYKMAIRKLCAALALDSAITGLISKRASQSDSKAIETFFDRLD